jgi:hypothetical protein
LISAPEAASIKNPIALVKISRLNIAATLLQLMRDALGHFHAQLGVK